MYRSFRYALKIIFAELLLANDHETIFYYSVSGVNLRQLIPHYLISFNPLNAVLPSCRNQLNELN